MGLNLDNDNKRGTKYEIKILERICDPFLRHFIGPDRLGACDEVFDSDSPSYNMREVNHNGLQLR